MKIRFSLVLSLCFGLLAHGNLRASTVGACNLLTASDAETALGDKVGDAQVEDGSFGAGVGSSCRYRSTGGPILSAKSVSLSVRRSESDLSGSVAGIAENLRSAGFKNVHDVTGIGSAAVWGRNSVLGRFQGELTVVQGRSVMLIVIIKGVPDETDALSRAKTIAATALQRL